MKTIHKIFHFFKPFLAAIAILAVLQLTGLLGSVTYVAQSTIMKTGLLDAREPDMDKKQADFDFNFTIKDLQGNKKPFEEYRGKVVFLNLWATWCGPCRAEMPTIEEIYGQFDKSKVAFVMLSIDKDQDHDKIVRYVQNKKFTFPVFQPSGYLTDQLQVPNIPTTFVISKDGKVADKIIGTTNYNSPRFKKFIDELIAK